jgi:hypothetical protein
VSEVRLPEAGSVVHQDDAKPAVPAANRAQNSPAGQAQPARRHRYTASAAGRCGTGSVSVYLAGAPVAAKPARRLFMHLSYQCRAGAQVVAKCASAASVSSAGGVSRRARSAKLGVRGAAGAPRSAPPGPKKSGASTNSTAGRAAPSPSAHGQRRWVRYNHARHHAPPPSKHKR